MKLPIMIAVDFPVLGGASQIRRYLAWGGLLPAGWRSSGRPSSEPAAAQFMIAEGFARR